LDLASLGIDHLGVTPSTRGLPGEISIEMARSICNAVKETVVTVALSVENNPTEILSMVEEVQPKILHLCGPENLSTPKLVNDMKTMLGNKVGNIKIMKAVSIKGHESIDLALEYSKVADYLILDTQSTDVYGIGASGSTHDWDISKKIVETSNIPVILAGGLSPKNVSEAIQHVKPWGVDSLTHTNKPLNNGRFRKDVEKVKDFVSASR